MVTAYLYNSCSSCRKAEEVLTETGVTFEKREFFKQKFSREELTDLLNRTGLSVSDVLSTRSTPYRELKLAEKNLSDDEVIDLMLKEPRLLKRPIVVNGNRAVVGFKANDIRALVQSGDTQ